MISSESNHIILESFLLGQKSCGQVKILVGAKIVKPKLVGRLEPSYRAMYALSCRPTGWTDLGAEPRFKTTTVHGTVCLCIAKIGLRVLLQIKGKLILNFEHWRDEFRK